MSETIETVTNTFAALPALGAPLAGGLFAGITTTKDGTHCAVVLLGDKPSKNLAWQPALDWARSLGDGADLPSRPVAAMLFANLRDQLKPRWHWTNEPEGSSYAWLCLFGYGTQNYSYRLNEGGAVAVRCIPLTA